jgi:hypothetical protein
MCLHGVAETLFWLDYYESSYLCKGGLVEFDFGKCGITVQESCRTSTFGPENRNQLARRQF